jgi:hypothetical protein
MNDSIDILVNAKTEAERRVKEDPSRRNLDALEKATTMLRNAMGAPGGGEGDGGRAFRNRLEVMQYLQAQGYKIRKSKLYLDAKSGLLRVNPDGTLTMAQVDKYVNHPKSGLLRLRLDNDGGLLPSQEIEDLQRQKLIIEIKKNDEQARRLQFAREKEEGEHIHRNILEVEMAFRAAVLDTGLKHLLARKGAEWIRMVHGQETRLDELIASMSQDIDNLMTQYADTRTFTVEIRAKNKSESATHDPLEPIFSEVVA